MHMKDDRDFKVSTPVTVTVTVTIREEIREMIIILCLRLFSWVSKELSNVRSPLLEPQAFSTFQPKIIYIYIKTTFPENEKKKKSIAKWSHKTSSRGVWSEGNEGFQVFAHCLRHYPSHSISSVGEKCLSFKRWPCRSPFRIFVQ